jgi:hypothetical protein
VRPGSTSATGIATSRVRPRAWPRATGESDHEPNACGSRGLRRPRDAVREPHRHPGGWIAGSIVKLSGDFEEAVDGTSDSPASSSDPSGRRSIGSARPSTMAYCGVGRAPLHDALLGDRDRALRDTRAHHPVERLFGARDPIGSWRFKSSPAHAREPLFSRRSIPAQTRLVRRPARYQEHRITMYSPSPRTAKSGSAWCHRLGDTVQRAMPEAETHGSDAWSRPPWAGASPAATVPLRHR